MANWEIRGTPEGERYLACLPLEHEGLHHAFTLRSTTPGRADRAHLSSIACRLGLIEGSVAVPAQVHGNIVASPDGSGGTRPHEADAVVVTGAGAAAVATADCVGAVLFEPRARAFGVIHAGWRGTLACVLPEAIRVLSERAGARPASIILALGPAIGGCCYEVGEEVVGAYRGAFPSADANGVFSARSSRTTLDLVTANRVQAEGAGVSPSRIHAAEVCTACRQDICWSYRVEGKAAGRMWALAVLPG